MTPTLTRPRPAQLRRAGRGLLVAGGVAILAVATAALVPGMRLPHFVRRVTIVNPTVYRMEVEVSRGPGDGWLDLGGISRESRRNVNEVVDQGERWVFRFRHGGADAGQLAVSRAELARDGWRITVPRHVGERLAAAGTPPSAR
jgi:hypothetical protein